jgi:hypothetical protein
MIIINSKHIKADEGKVLIRTWDNMNFGFEAFLGKSLRDGVLVDDTPEDFHEEDYVPDDGGDEPMEN